MKDILYHNPKIEIRRSPIAGWGVFAKEDIEQDEILEEAPFLTLPMDPYESSSLFIDYRFNFPANVPKWKEQAIPFGFTCLYNHSNTESSAFWYTDEENRLFIFKTKRFIKKDEEILVYYGSESYWKDGRTHINVK